MREKIQQVTTSLLHAKKRRKKNVSQETLERQRAILTSLEETSQYLAIEVDVKTILERIAETTGKALGAKYVNFWDFTPDRKGLFIAAAYGMQQQYIDHSKKSPIPVGSAWIGRAVKTGHAWATKNIKKDPRLLKEIGSWAAPVKKQDYHGLLCIPMMRGKESIGGMCIYYKDIHEFEYFEMSLATIVANQAATAMQNARIFGELTQETQKNQSMVASLYDGLIVLDSEGIITAFNPRAEELLWVKARNVIGRKSETLPVAKNALYKNIQKIIALPLIEFESQEYAMREPSRRTIEVTSVPLKNSNNMRIGSMKVLHDITREKEVAQLESKFVTVASHQLRTPLSGLKWSLNLLLEERMGPLTKEQREIITKSNTVNERLITLVNDLLDVSRIEEGRFQFTFTEVDINDLLEEIRAELDSQIREGNLVFTLEHESKAQKYLIQADREKVKMIFFNLIDNAVKYTLPGGFVRVRLRIQKKSIIFSVEDSGIGIRADDQKHIFTKFFRARNAIRLKTEGSGLGLFIVKELTKYHHGRAWFESMENKGSTFYIQLPIKQPEGFARGEESITKKARK